MREELAPSQDPSDETGSCLLPRALDTPCLLLSVVLLTSSAAAQDEAGDDFSLLSLEELMSIDVQMVEGASRRMQSVADAPASVTVIGRDEIRRLGHRTLADVLTGVRSFDVTDDLNYAHLGVRGFNPLGDYNSRVLLLVDGHRVNNPIYDSAAIGREFPVDIALIERIEIVRGPGSALYGSNAFFAVINVITRRGGDVDGTELSLAAGSENARQGSATWGRLSEDGSELLISADAWGSDGSSQHYPEFGAPPPLGITSGTDDESSRGAYLAWSRDGFQLQGMARFRTKGVPTASYGTVFDDDRTDTRDDQWALDASWRDELSGDWSSLLRVTYDGYDYEGDYVYDYADPGDPAFLVVNQDSGRSEMVGAEALFIRDADDGHVLTMGAEVRHAFRVEQANRDLAVYLDDDRSFTSTGVFAQDELSLNDELTLVLGARADHVSSFDTTTSPRAALVWQAAEDTTFKLLFGQAFRAPNAYERFYHDGYSTQKPASDLDKETISTLELVWEEQLDQTFSTAVSVYRYEIDDLITQVADPADGLLVFVNQGSVESEGLELELMGRSDDGFTGRLSQSWQNPRDGDSDDPLLNSPSSLTKLALVAPLVPDQLFLGAQVSWTSERRTLGNARTSDALLADLTLSYEGGEDGWDLSASIHNLFDQRYDVPGGGEHLQDQLQQPGRTLLARATRRF